MAGLGAGTGVATLAELGKLLDPNGKIARVIELLTQTNDMLMDIQWMEGNLPTGHRTTIRTGLPTVYWRLINQGVQSSTPTEAQVDETCGNLEAWSRVDKKLAMLSSDINAFRLTRAKAFIEAMNQKFAYTFFYGNSSITPEEYHGLSIRYSSLSATNGQNIVSGSGSGSDNTSIWLVGHGENKVMGIYPKGSTAGLQHFDIGEETAEAFDGVAGSVMRVLTDQWTWDCGVCVEDWRYAVRGANIDVSNLVAESSAADLIKMMTKMYHRIPFPATTKLAFYMNRTVFQQLDIQRHNLSVSGTGISFAEIDGMVIPKFRNIPIRICDQLLNTESAVS